MTEKKGDGGVRVYKMFAHVSGLLYMRVWTLVRTEVRENEIAYRLSEHKLAFLTARYEHTRPRTKESNDQLANWEVTDCGYFQCYFVERGYG